MTNLHCTFFRNAKDPVARPWEGTWVQLCRLLSQSFRPDPHVGGQDLKLRLPAMSPATFDPPRRGRAQVKTLHLLAFDFDNTEYRPIPGQQLPNGTPVLEKQCLDVPVSMVNIEDALKAKGVAGFGWSTWSDRANWPRHRTLVPLAEPIPPQHWAVAVAWSIAELGLSDFSQGMDLVATRDVARIYFLPAHPEDLHLVRRYRVEGRALRIPWRDFPNPAEAVIPLGPIAPSPLGGGKRGICPWAKQLRVDLSTLRLSDLMADLGIWVGPPTVYQGGLRWRTRCPWALQHTGQKDDDAGVIFHSPGHWPVWRCAHASHQHLGLEDILRYAGVLR